MTKKVSGGLVCGYMVCNLPWNSAGIGRIPAHIQFRTPVRITKPVSGKIDTAKERFSALEITKDKIKNATANFFGVSGGVTAGVETIQTAKENKSEAA